LVLRTNLVLVVAVIVAIATVAPAATASGATAATDAPEATDATDAATSQSGTWRAVNESTCAAESPDDHADPDGDPLGWEAGVWYDEPVAVDQSDGLNDTELNRTLARTMARVEYVRCLEFEHDVPVEIIDRAEFRDRQLQRRVAPGLRTFDNAKFEAMFLVNESADSIAVQNRNRGTAVLGYYDPPNDTIVVVSESRESLRIDETTLAHELVHALQDERYNLSSEPFRVRLRDDANAMDGVVEGDASYVDHLYAQRCAGAWNGTCLEQARASNASLANIGVYFLKFQPYSDGPGFVRLAYEFGGWDAVNELYEEPPASTEQVIHPQRYGWDEPSNVSLEDTAGDNWTRVRPPDRPDYASVGETGLVAMLVYPTYHSQGQTSIVPPSDWLNTNRTGEVREFDPLHYDHNYTRGWDGDRLHVYQDGDGELAYVWRLEWDSPADAREFLLGYSQVLRYWGAEQVGPSTWVIEDGGFADAFHVSVEGTTVTITNAPSVEQLPEVRSEVDVSGVNATADAGNATAEPASAVQ
jgi:hypothetical protein